MTEMTDKSKTFDLAAEFQEAYRFFNGKLFAGHLPEVVITTQRHRGAAGFFSHDSYEERVFCEGVRQPGGFSVHEIAVMPDVMWDLPDREVLSTLVHEMCHCWQHEYGKPSRGGYHNRQWAEKMRSVGLEPSSRGRFDVRNPALTEAERKSAVEGTATGQSMSHFIMPGGRFDAVCGELLDGGFTLSLHQSPGITLAKPKSKLKYTCPACGLRAWAKAGCRLACGDCHVDLQCEEAEDAD